MVVIGGSAGSLHVITEILRVLPPAPKVPVMIVVHRMRNVNSDLDRLLFQSSNGAELIEPDDKAPVKAGKIYLAPQNYHLLVEEDHFSLDYSEAVMYSRPSIDVSFESVALRYKKHVLGILLSGANSDGAHGLCSIAEQGGVAIAQEPTTAEYPIMPQSALKMNKNIHAYTPEQIIQLIQSIQ